MKNTERTKATKNKNYRPIIKSILLVILVTIGFPKFNSYGTDSKKLHSCNKAKTLITNYQFDLALQELQLCETTNTEHTKDIAYCYYKLGQLNEAETHYKKVLTENEYDVLTRNQLANIYAKKSDFKKCTEEYKSLLKIDSSNTYYHKQLAIYAKKDNDIILAFTHLGIANKINPNDLSVINLLVKIFMEQEQFDQVEIFIEKGLAVDSLNEQLLLYKAKLAYKNKEYNTVLESISKSLPQQNDTTSYQMKLLGIANYHLENYETSIQCMNKVLKDQEAEIIHYYLGLSYKELKSFDKSTAHLEKAINMGITDHISTYYAALGTVMEQNEDYKGSINAYQTAYKYSKNKVILFHLARNYDTYYADKQTALAYYERYLSHNDTNHRDLMSYSEYRINEIQEQMHFEMGSEN